MAANTETTQTTTTVELALGNVEAAYISSPSTGISGAPYSQILQNNPNRIDATRAQLDKWLSAQSNDYLDFLMRSMTSVNIPLYGMELTSLAISPSNISFSLSAGAVVCFYKGKYIIVRPNVSSGSVLSFPRTGDGSHYLVKLIISETPDETIGSVAYDIGSKANTPAIATYTAEVALVPTSVAVWSVGLNENETGTHIISTEYSLSQQVLSPLKFLPTDGRTVKTGSNITLAEVKVLNEDGTYNSMLDQASAVDNIIRLRFAWTANLNRAALVSEVIGTGDQANAVDIYTILDQRVRTALEVTASALSLSNHYNDLIFDPDNYPSTNGQYMSVESRLSRMETGDGLPPRFLQTTYEIDLRTFSFEMIIVNDGGTLRTVVDAATLMSPAFSTNNVDIRLLKRYLDEQGPIQMAYSRINGGYHYEIKKNGSTDIVYYLRAAFHSTYLELFTSYDAVNFTHSNNKSLAVTEHQASGGDSNYWLAAIGCHSDGRVVIRHGLPYQANILGFEIDADRISLKSSQSADLLGFKINGQAFNESWGVTGNASNNDLTDDAGSFRLGNQSRVIVTAYDGNLSNTACFQGRISVTYAPAGLELIDLWGIQNPPSVEDRLPNTFTARNFITAVVGAGALLKDGATVLVGRGPAKPSMVIPYYSAMGAFGPMEGQRGALSMIPDSHDLARYAESDYGQRYLEPSINYNGSNIFPMYGSEFLCLANLDSDTTIDLIYTADTGVTFAMPPGTGLHVFMHISEPVFNALTEVHIILEGGSGHMGKHFAPIGVGLNEFIFDTGEYDYSNGSPDYNIFNKIYFYFEMHTAAEWGPSDLAIDALSIGAPGSTADAVTAMELFSGNSYLGTQGSGLNRDRAGINRRLGNRWLPEFSLAQLVSSFENAFHGTAPVQRDGFVYFYTPGLTMTPGTLGTPDRYAFNQNYLIAKGMGIPDEWSYIRGAMYAFRNNDGLAVIDNRLACTTGEIDHIPVSLRYFGPTDQIPHYHFVSDAESIIQGTGGRPLVSGSDHSYWITGTDMKIFTSNSGDKGQFQVIVSPTGGPTQWWNPANGQLIFYVYFSTNGLAEVVGGSHALRIVVLENPIEVSGTNAVPTYSWNVDLPKSSLGVGWNRIGCHLPVSQRWSRRVLFSLNTGDNIANGTGANFALGDFGIGPIRYEKLPANHAFRIIDNGVDWLLCQRNTASNHSTSAHMRDGNFDGAIFQVESSHPDRVASSISRVSAGVGQVSESITDKRGSTISAYTFDIECSKRMTTKQASLESQPGFGVGEFDGLNLYANASGFISDIAVAAGGAMEKIVLSDANVWTDFLISADITTNWLEDVERIGFISKFGTSLYAGMGSDMALWVARPLIIIKRSSVGSWELQPIDASLDDYNSTHCAIQYDGKLYISISKDGGLGSIAILTTAGGTLDDTNIKDHASEVFSALGTDGTTLLAGTGTTGELHRLNAGVWQELTVPWADAKITAIKYWASEGLYLIAVGGAIYTMDSQLVFVLARAQVQAGETVADIATVEEKAIVLYDHSASGRLDILKYETPTEMNSHLDDAAILDLA